MNALGIDEKKENQIWNEFSQSKNSVSYLWYELNCDEQREFIKQYLCNDNKEVFFRQINILHEFRLLIKRNEIVDKMKLLRDKNLGNFAEKLVLEIAEDTNGNEELLNKVHEILNK